MKRFVIFMAVLLTFTEMSFSQSSRSQVLYGEKGLMVTEGLLDELDLPEWFWGGAHVYETLEMNYRLVNGALLDKYFRTIPASGMSDPQHFLDDEQREKIEKIIAAHDMKSAIPLYVNVLAYGQNLAINETEVKRHLSAMFKEKNAMVIFYYYGYARGVKGYVLLDEQGFIEDWEVDELFLRSAQDASLLLGKFGEMEGFVTEFSKRSYWLEQRLIKPVMAEKSSALKENERPEKSGIPNEFLRMLSEHTLTLTLILCTLLAGGWYHLWNTKWRKYVIPDGSVATRLGADHGANISDTVAFADPKISLTDQREKIKNREL